MISDDNILKLKFIKKRENTPYEIRIDINGNVYVDGKPYDKNNSPYNNLTIDVEKHSKLSTGEETQKIIESSKKAKKGETVTIKDIKMPERTETTTVKF